MTAHAHQLKSSEAGTQDPREPTTLLLRDLRTTEGGLASMEAARRLIVHGNNELTRRPGRHWARELYQQFVHPLALLLWAALGWRS